MAEAWRLAVQLFLLENESPALDGVSLQRLSTRCIDKKWALAPLPVILVVQREGVLPSRECFLNAWRLRIFARDQ